MHSQNITLPILHLCRSPVQRCSYLRGVAEQMHINDAFVLSVGAEYQFTHPVTNRLCKKRGLSLVLHLFVSLSVISNATAQDLFPFYSWNMYSMAHTQQFALAGHFGFNETFCNLQHLRAKSETRGNEQ